MLTDVQRKYLETISDTKIIHIKPYNPKCNEVAHKLIEQIKSSSTLDVLYTGASALGISGVNDIDFTILCPRLDFQKYLPRIEKILGKPQKIGEQNIRWEGIEIGGVAVDVHMTDPNNPFLAEHIQLFELLKNNRRLLKEYEELKQKCDGFSYKEYQRAKYEFYNKVLGLH